MLPYWIELSAADLMQGTAFMVMAMFITIQFLLPTRRA